MHLRGQIMNFFFKTSGPLIRHLEKRGIFVVYWVLNNQDDFRKAVEVRFYFIDEDIIVINIKN